MATAGLSRRLQRLTDGMGRSGVGDAVSIADARRELLQAVENIEEREPVDPSEWGPAKRLLLEHLQRIAEDAEKVKP